MNARSPLMLLGLLSAACATTSPPPLSAEPPKPAERTEPVGAQPQTEHQKTMYALGLTLGGSLAVFELTAEDLEFVRAGLYAQVKGEPPAVDLVEYGRKISAVAMERQAARAAAEQARGKAFREKAAQEPGAVKSESGLIYQELRAGTGASPAPTSTVRVNYRGTTVDGREFDSSSKHGGPASFPLDGVVRCWTEGLQRMKVGGKARLVCPPELAYGERGAPPAIPSGATLVFEVELLEVVPAP